MKALIFALAALVAPLSAQEPFTVTDAKGAAVKGWVYDIQENWITFVRESDGKTFTVPPASLSEECRQRLKAMEGKLAAQRREAKRQAESQEKAAAVAFEQYCKHLDVAQAEIISRTSAKGTERLLVYCTRPYADSELILIHSETSRRVRVKLHAGWNEIPKLQDATYSVLRVHERSVDYEGRLTLPFKDGILCSIKGLEECDLGYGFDSDAP